MSVKIAMIAAVGRNMAIGSGGDLPWRLPTDFAFYKRTTMGKPLVMGRKTFESMGGPLPGRSNLIVTRDTSYAAEGAEVFSDLDAAIGRAREIAEGDGVDEVMINGGGEIYALAMPQADRLYITHVDATPDADTFFPQIDPGQWDVHVLKNIRPGERDALDFVVKIYERS